MQQVAFRFEKREPARFLSHLEVVRTLERALRRAGIALAYSQGFNPHPRMAVAAALATGATSQAELALLELESPLPAHLLADRLNEKLPAGLRVLEAWTIPAHHPRFSVGKLDTAEYLVAGPGWPDDLPARVERLLSMQECQVEKPGPRGARRIDLRPLILALEARADGRGSPGLWMRLPCQGVSVRPEQVAQALGLPGPFRVHRAALYTGEPASVNR